MLYDVTLAERLLKKQHSWVMVFNSLARSSPKREMKFWNEMKLESYQLPMKLSLQVTHSLNLFKCFFGAPSLPWELTSPMPLVSTFWVIWLGMGIKKQQLHQTSITQDTFSTLLIRNISKISENWRSHKSFFWVRRADLVGSHWP